MYIISLSCYPTRFSRKNRNFFLLCHRTRNVLKLSHLIVYHIHIIYNIYVCVYIYMLISYQLKISSTYRVIITANFLSFFSINIIDWLISSHCNSCPLVSRPFRTPFFLYFFFYVRVCSSLSCSVRYRKKKIARIEPGNPTTVSLPPPFSFSLINLRYLCTY